MHSLRKLHFSVRISDHFSNFAGRKMDMLVADLALKDEIAKSNNASRAMDEDEEEPGFRE